MGIDLSVAVGVGATIGSTKAIAQEFPDFEDDPYEVLYNLFQDDYPLLDYVRAGSSWSGEVEYLLVVRSHNVDFNPKMEDGGVTYLKSPEITPEEMLQFLAAFRRLTGKDFTETPRPFVSLHVY